MFVLAVPIHPVDDALTLLFLIVAPVLSSPFEHVIPLHAKVVEQVGGVHHIVMVGARPIGDVALGQHLLDDRPGSLDLGVVSAHRVFLAALAGFRIGSRISSRCLVIGNEEGLCLEVEHGLPIVGDTTQACDIAALGVIGHAAQVGIVLVAFLIGCAI